MIKLIDKDFLLDEKFRKFCLKSIFGVKIYSIYSTYDISLDFVDTWYQLNKLGMIVSAVSRFENNYILATSIFSDKDELNEFISFQKMNTLLCDSRFQLNKECIDRKTNAGMKFLIKYASFKGIQLISPTPEEYYDVLKEAKSEDFIVPDYNNFLSDITYRKNRNRCALFGQNFCTSLASVCMSVCECDGAAIIGCVATHPNYRNRGLCSTTVNRAASLLLLDNKDVYIFPQNDKAFNIYKKIGFKKICEYTEYRF